MTDLIPDAIQIPAPAEDALTETLDALDPDHEITPADVIREVRAMRADIAQVVALVIEVGPTLEMLMEEAKARGLVGLLPLLMSLRKA